jgi:hypothetical protein
MDDVRFAFLKPEKLAELRRRFAAQNINGLSRHIRDFGNTLIENRLATMSHSEICRCFSRFFLSPGLHHARRPNDPQKLL